ncbi:MAG TPA: hypothetical protein VFK07_02005 [Candidatus Paceibacterota bacterium]|nr:hypothetical protein [Candidatus Paceibacterota bacterium]
MSIKYFFTAAAIASMAALPLYSKAQSPEYLVPSSWWLTPTQTFSVGGVGYPANTTVTVNALGTSKNVTTDGSGNFSGVSFSVPYNAGGSTLAISAGDASINVGVAGYSPWIVLSTYYAPVGSGVTVFGHGFGPGERVDVSYNGSSFASTTASSNGDWSANGTIPNNASSGNFRAVGASTGQTATSAFSVALSAVVSPTPTISPTPTPTTTPTPSVTPTPTATPQIQTTVTVSLNHTNILSLLQAIPDIASGALAHDSVQIQLFRGDGSLAWQGSSSAQTWSDLVDAFPDSFTLNDATLAAVPAGTYQANIQLYGSNGTLSRSFNGLLTVTISH